jgi:hypothetical protein
MIHTKLVEKEGVEETIVLQSLGSLPDASLLSIHIVSLLNRGGGLSIYLYISINSHFSLSLSLSL